MAIDKRYGFVLYYLVYMPLRSDNKKSGPSGIIAWFMNLFGPTGPEQRKRRLLKQLEKSINRSRYKFYRPKGKLVLPGLGKFFFEIHKITANTFSLLPNVKNSEGLKGLCVEAFMTKEQLGLLASLDEKLIRESAKTQDQQAYTAKIEENLKRFISGVDSKTMELIDDSYSRILRFVDFIGFDYYFLLKKFNSRFRSGGPPPSHFESINGDYISTDLRDFLDIFLILDLDADWSKIFDILSKYRSMGIINRSAWSRLIHAFKGIFNSGIFVMIVQHLMQKPLWKPSLIIRKVSIADAYLTKLRARTERVIQEVQSEKLSSEVEKLCKEVFGRLPVTQMEHYTKKANLMFSNLSVRYEYVMPMNYLKAFFTDHFQKEIQEFTNLLVIRGKWVTSDLSKNISEPYYQVIEISERLTKFDESLDEEGERGSHLKRALSRVVVNDSTTSTTARMQVQETNEAALVIVNEAARRLILFGNSLKMLIEDIATGALLINWDELTIASEQPLKTRMATEYKRVYYLIQLLRFFVK